MPGGGKVEIADEFQNAVEGEAWLNLYIYQATA